MKLLLFMLALLPLLWLANALEHSTAVFCNCPHIKVTARYCENHTGLISYHRCDFACTKDKLVAPTCTRYLFGKNTYPRCCNICCITPTKPTTSTSTTTTTTSTTTPSTVPTQ